MKKNYFIPILKTINDQSIPSTPFKDSIYNDIYLGDVFEVINPNGGKIEFVLAELSKGQYIGISNNENSKLSIETPLWMFEGSEVKILGSSIEYPELLEKIII